MAKELPYFKFEPSEWDNGNIQLCSSESKGIFIDVCSMYWSRVGELPYKLAVRKLCSNDESLLNELIDERIITIKDDMIMIEFLDIQLSQFKLISKTASNNAYSRWDRTPERIKGQQVYVIRCWGNGEEFIKIGETKSSINRRFSGKFPYEFEAIIVDVDCEIRLEAIYANIAKGCEYSPKLPFHGQKECFKTVCINDLIKFAKHRNAKYVRSNAIREDKSREDKKKKDSKGRFTPPTSEQVSVYFTERGIVNSKTEAVKFIDHYQSNGWMVGKNKMKDWKAAARNWITRMDSYSSNGNSEVITSLKVDLSKRQM